MRLWRTLPFDKAAAPSEPGGALWFPREQQGYGRHDNADLYGCLYVSEDPVSAVAESLAAFRGTGRLTASMLTQVGRPLALAELALPDDAVAIDLDDPDYLASRGLRPSWIATRQRKLTQAIARDLYIGTEAVGIRWWSTLEASLTNWTIYDRAAESLSLTEVTELRIDDPVVREAAALLGLTP